MNLALGYVCVVYDYGSRGTGMEDEREGIPRAFWYVNANTSLDDIQLFQLILFVSCLINFGISDNVL